MGYEEFAICEDPEEQVSHLMQARAFGFFAAPWNSVIFTDENLELIENNEFE